MIDIDHLLAINDVDEQEQMVEDNHNHLIFRNLMTVLLRFDDKFHYVYSIKYKNILNFVKKNKRENFFLYPFWSFVSIWI